MKPSIIPRIVLLAALALPSGLLSAVAVQAQSEVTTTTTVSPSRATPTPTPEEAQVDYYLKIPPIEGESDSEEDSSHMDEVMTKPEEGIEPDEIDFDGDSELEGVEPDEIDNANRAEDATNFSILLGGGDDDSDETKAKRQEAADIILEGAQQADDVPMETLSLNFGKVEATIPKDLKVLGFIPVSTSAAVSIDSDGNVKVRFPWWAIFASGKDSDALGQRVRQTLSNVLKTREHEVGHALGLE